MNEKIKKHRKAGWIAAAVMSAVMVGLLVLTFATGNGPGQNKDDTNNNETTVEFVVDESATFI